MQEWQPIETAPKDGEAILVASSEGHVKEAFWKDAWYGDEENPGWMIANCDEGYGYYLEAIAWQPLPAAPQPAQGNGT